MTDRKLAEDAARAAEEKFRFIVESATEFAIFTTDLAGRVDSWNSGAQRILGYDEQEILGQDCRLVFTPEDNAMDQPDREMQSALTRGSGSDERWHVRKGGERFWASGLMMPLRDDAGTVRGYLKILRDMTRQKRADEALRASEDALKEADSRKDEFLAMLAHELRNPLAAISNAVALSRHAAKNPAEIEWTTAVIERQTRHLATLLDGLLDVSRIKQGRIQLQKQVLDIAEVITNAIQAVRPLIEDRRHALTVLDRARADAGSRRPHQDRASSREHSHKRREVYRSWRSHHRDRAL